MKLPTVYIVMRYICVDGDESEPIAVFPDKHSAKAWVIDQKTEDEGVYEYYLEEVPMHPESELEL